jgi:peptide-methionine (S)-S-oxide reductase
LDGHQAFLSLPIGMNNWTPNVSGAAKTLPFEFRFLLKATMKILFLPLTILASVFVLQACSQAQQPKSDAQLAVENAAPVEVPIENGLKTAYFASGCFWCVEVVYEGVKGVKESTSGYAGGHTDNPTYELSNTGRTGHAEAVEVLYDPEVVSFATLVDVYFGSQNVTQVNGQGPDRGPQYRSIVFYQNAKENQIIEAKKKAIEGATGENVAAEILPFQKFWVAEDYHQDYKKRNPNNAYIKAVSNPRLQEFKAKFQELLKD